jgi:hypothetical protein
MRRAFDAFDSPEAIERAQRDQVAAFCELFGSDELTVPSAKLSPTLERFQRYLISERRDPETGLTPAERFRKELGQELTVPELPSLPEPVAGAGEVTILCDDFDGIVLLPDFNRFKRVFETDEPDRQVPDWRDLVWTYIKNPDIPIVAFERVTEQFPLRVEKIVATLVGDKDFSVEHLYAVLLHYKQPVEGLDNLKDDQHLWDLFNGNAAAAKPSKGSAKKSKPQSPVKTQPKKAASKTTGPRWHVPQPLSKRLRPRRPLQSDPKAASVARKPQQKNERAALNPLRSDEARRSNKNLSRTLQPESTRRSIADRGLPAVSLTACRLLHRQVD